MSELGQLYAARRLSRSKASERPACVLQGLLSVASKPCAASCLGPVRFSAALQRVQAAECLSAVNIPVTRGAQ